MVKNKSKSPDKVVLFSLLSAQNVAPGKQEPGDRSREQLDPTTYARTHTHTHTELKRWRVNEYPFEILLTSRGKKGQPKARQCTFLCLLCSLFPNLQVDLEMSQP